MYAPVDTVAERVPPTAGVIEAIDENTCTLHTGANSLNILAMHVAMIGVDFEIHEPPELIEHIRTLAVRFTRAVG